MEDREWDEVEERPVRNEEQEPTTYELAEMELKHEERMHKFLWDEMHTV